MKKILIFTCLTCLSVFVAGCSWFEDKRVVVKPEPVDNRVKWKVLAPFVMKHFDTGDKTVEEVAAGLALQEYYLNKK